MSEKWSASTYLKFEDDRNRPANDLLNAIATLPPGRIIDVGCGPGNSTELLINRYPDRVVSGFDPSDDMLEKARARLPNVAFDKADVTVWTPPKDAALLYSNAVFQWVPDHVDQMIRLVSELPEGAALAMQVPDNLGEPSHVAMAETAAEPDFAPLMPPTPGREKILAPRDYIAALQPYAARVEVWRTVYHPLLDGIDGIIAWFKGSGLRPFLRGLDEETETAFIASYRRKLKAAYPLLPDGRVALPFPRVFVIAIAKG